MSNDLNIEGWSKCLNCGEAQRDVRMWHGQCENCHWENTIDHGELHDLAEAILDLHRGLRKSLLFEDEGEQLMKKSHDAGLLIEDETGWMIINPKLRRQK